MAAVHASETVVSSAPVEWTAVGAVGAAWSVVVTNSAALAPEGKSSLYVELADRREPSLPDLLPRVADGLVEMGLASRAGAIRFARLRRIDYAYVVFDHDYYGALERIRPFLAEAGIVSAGRYGGWNYSSMEDALLFGRDAAREAARLLGEERAS